MRIRFSCADTFAIRHEPQLAVLGDHPEARVLQGNDARRAPFFGYFILKEDFDGIADPIGFNQTLGHGLASSTQTAGS